jgi:hypothetical protein
MVVAVRPANAWLERLRNKASKPRNQRKRSNNLSKLDRKAAAAATRLKQRRLYLDLEGVWKEQDAVAVRMAAKHGKTVKWMREQVHQTARHLKSRRPITDFNAWQHCQSLIINESE